jgi:death on curing protein
LQQDRLEAAVNAPRAAFGGLEMHADPIAKATALFFSLAHGHAFNDGNKRTALACLNLVLELNGWTILATDVELEELTLAVACGTKERDQSEDFVRSRCRMRLD